MAIRDWFKNKAKDAGEATAERYRQTKDDAKQAIRSAPGNAWDYTKQKASEINQKAPGVMWDATKSVVGGGARVVGKSLLQLSGRFTWPFVLLCAGAHYALLVTMPMVSFDGAGSFFTSFMQAISTPLFLLVYLAMLPLLATFLFYSDTGDMFPLRRLFKFIALSVVAYMVPVVIHSLTRDGGASVASIGGILLIFSPIWLYYIFANPGDKLTRILAGVFWIVFAFILLLQVAAYIKDQGFAAQTEAVDLRGAWNVIVGVGQQTQEYATDAYTRFKQGWSNQLNRTTQDFYVGQVDQSQGAPLGVFVEEPRTDYDKYYMDQSDVITATAVLKARSLVDEVIKVDNTCLLEIQDTRISSAVKSVNITGTVSPAISTFVYTADFQDRQDIQCVVPAEKVKELTNQNRVYTATVHFTSTFDFTTLGYMPFAFMDRDLFVALRRDKLDPAQEMGVAANPTAVYTPGPLMIGMARDSQPFPYDPEDKATALPAFGTTFGAGTYGKGRLLEVKELHLYIPQQFELQREECTPSWLYNKTNPTNNRLHFNNANKETFTTWSENDMYWDYVVDDAAIQDGQTFLTLRCPLVRNQRGTGSQLPLIGPAGASLYTFYVKASYKYASEARVQVLLQGAAPTPPDFSDTPVTGAQTPTTVQPNTCKEVNCNEQNQCSCFVRDSNGQITTRCSWTVGNQPDKKCTTTDAAGASTSTGPWPEGAPAKGSTPLAQEPSCAVTACQTTISNTIWCGCEQTQDGKAVRSCSWYVGSESTATCNNVVT